MKNYLATCYDKNAGKITIARAYDTLEEIVRMVNCLEQQISGNSECPIKNFLEFQISLFQKANNFEAEIISTPNFAWSIFVLK